MVKISEKTREEVRNRAGRCCEYCLSQEFFSPSSFSIEHIIPKSKGGTNAPDNLALACMGCNNHKYNKTQHLDPASQTEVAIYHPRRQAWQKHFAWNDDLTRVVGLTPTGRATIICLQLNRQELINLRSLLVAFGEHPPRST